MDWTTTEFLKPWQRLNFEQGEPLLREVLTEISPGYALYGMPLVPIARSLQADDVLFQLDDNRVVTVHITYRRAPEPPPWPSSRIYENLDAWVEEIMIPQNQEYIQ
jgi:hypothetical protein